MTGEPLAPVRQACVEVFGLRAQQTWPPTVTVYDHWARIYAGARSSGPDLDLASNVQEAAQVVNDFIRRVDGQLAQVEKCPPALHPRRWRRGSLRGSS